MPKLVPQPGDVTSFDEFAAQKRKLGKSRSKKNASSEKRELQRKKRWWANNKRKTVNRGDKKRHIDAVHASSDAGGAELSYDVGRSGRGNAKSEGSSSRGGTAELEDKREGDEEVSEVMSDSEDIAWISSRDGGHCDNCRRHHVEELSRHYDFRMCRVRSSDLKNMSTPLKTVSVECGDDEKLCCLCESCYFFLAKSADDKTRHSWSNVWPSFFWNLLVGKDESTGISFRCTYSPEHLWRFVPSTVRRYWLKSIRGIEGYSRCTADYPSSLFIDRTIDIDCFFSNIEKFTSEAFLRALDPSRVNGVNGEDCSLLPIVLPNVLCPWGCTEFCFTSKQMCPSILMQHHLRRVQLNLCVGKGGIGHDSLYLCETSRLDYFRKDNESVDYVLMNEQWPILPSMHLSSKEGLMCLVCRNHSNPSEQKVLYPHPPRKGLNNLSPVYAANLCHAVLRPRSLKANKPSMCGTATSIRQSVSGFTGIDSANITTDPRFSKPSFMLFEDEIKSLHRRDLRELLDVYVKEGKVDPALRDQWLEGYYDRYKCKDEEVRSLRRGSTYCPTKNAIILQTHASDTSKVKALIPGRKVRNSATTPDQEVYIARSWDPIIYNNMCEDGENYGSPIKAIRPYQYSDDTGRQVGMMLWTLVGMVSGCSDLHYAIDQKATPHHHSELSGHLLTHISSEYMKHRTNNSPKISPFSAQNSLTSVKEAMLHLMPSAMKNFRGTRSDSLSRFYRFGITYFQKIFPRGDYPSLSVHTSVHQITSSPRLLSDRNIFIVVSSDAPTGEANFELPSSEYFPSREKYEARVLIGVSPVDPLNRDRFTGTRFARHGNGMVEWWQDFRHRKARQVMTQYVMPSLQRKENLDPFPSLPSNCVFFVTVYVKVDNKISDSYRYDLYRSLGVQTKVSCNCEEGLSPLVVSGRQQKDKRKCTSAGCNRKEGYTCPRPHCATRICSKCFENHSKSIENVILERTSANEDEDVLMDDEAFDDGDDNDREGIDPDDCPESFWGDKDEASGEEEDCEDGIGGIEGPVHRGVRGEEFFCDASLSSCEEYEDDEHEIDSDDEFSCFENEGVGYDDPIRFRSLEEKMADAYERRNMVDELPGGDRPQGDRPSVDVLMENYATSTDFSPLEAGDELDEYFNLNKEGDQEIPRTNAAEMEMTIRTECKTTSLRVLFNQIGSHCVRHTKRITGTMAQQNFVQTFVSAVRGVAFPILYIAGNLFPGHFWSGATHDEYAILGCPPISCHRREVHPNGFASHLQMARNLLTHASSSTSTCENYAAYCYDLQGNRAGSSLDSRQVARQGFRVSTSSSEGLELGRGKESNLQESVDSSQAAIDLAAASQILRFDLFLTLTCNQSQHPGIRHLFEWKQSMQWTKMVHNWNYLSEAERNEVCRSFEMAYMSVVSRSWLEVRKLLLQFIEKSTSTVLGRVVPVYWRDEFQEESGNLSHLHGLIGLHQGDMSDEDFLSFVCSLQRSAICDLITSDELEGYIKKGVIKDLDDFKTFTHQAESFLDHSCSSRRCLIKVANNGTPDDYKCKKRHPVRDSINPLEDDFIPIHYKWSQVCLDVLKDSGLYEPPSDSFPHGRFLDKNLQPTRHMGKVTPSATENLSPVIPEFFALTRSQQNVQIMTNTNGVARYVAKYILKMDAGNRCIIYCDSHTGAILRAEHQFLHNTKVTRSAINEKKAHNKSRARFQPVGRFISFTEMQQQLLGYNDVTTNIKFEHIESKPLEHRTSTKLTDKDGNLKDPSDVTMSLNGLFTVREEVCKRKMTINQVLTLRSSNRNFDKVSIFGLRPVELLELFPRIGEYFRWFVIDDEEMSTHDIRIGLNDDITKCKWIDCVGRRVRLRQKALPEVASRLQSVKRESVNLDSWTLRNHLLRIIKEGPDTTSIFVDSESKNEDLPIPVFSKVSPEQSSAFLLHVMIMLGEFKTELEFRQHNSLKESLAAAKLIPNDNLDSEEHLKQYGRDLLNRIIKEVFAVQPITLRKMDMYIVRCKRLLDSVLLDNDIPITDMPPSILTELLNEKHDELDSEWEERTSKQLDVMLDGLPEGINVPRKGEIMAATKEKPIQWDPLESFSKSDEQSDLSYKEQRASIDLAVRAVENYSRQFNHLTRTKGVLTHGSPGSGKSFVLLAQGLYAMTQGLRVLSTALMAKRSIALGGGYHLHRLFALETKKNGNPKRLAELAIDKLHRKSNLKMLHLLMTCDCLLLDEVGQLSAQQFSQLDIILRNIRHNNAPFGGVLIFGTFDHQQLGAVEGLPFLLSSHIMTDFTMVRMKHSVRAHSDTNLQRIQEITRMSPNMLLNNSALKEEFSTLLRDNVNFISDMRDDALGPEVQRMYSNRADATASAEEYIDESMKNLKRRKKKFVLCEAVDLQRPLASRRDLQVSTDNNIKLALDRKTREPKRLLFYEGALFEATVNEQNSYSQSQILMMLDIPTTDQINGWSDISMMAAPPKYTPLLKSDGVPDRDALLRDGWKEVKVKVAPERTPVTTYGSEAHRRQYTLRHLGSSTINKQMGNTIHGPVAIKVTKDSSPWQKAQVVVMLSRTPRASLIYIVGRKEEAIERLWNVITQRNQWSDYVESLLDAWSLEGDGIVVNTSDKNVLDMASTFPYKVCNITMPNSDTGFVYLLVSTVCSDRTYVGQTKNLAIRLVKHNSGYGSQGTADPSYLPYAPAAYITGMNHLTKFDRLRLEWKWKRLNQLSVNDGNVYIETRILNGEKIVEDYNKDAPPDKKLRMVVCIQRTQR